MMVMLLIGCPDDGSNGQSTDNGTTSGTDDDTTNAATMTTMPATASSSTSTGALESTSSDETSSDETGTTSSTHATESSGSETSGGGEEVLLSNVGNTCFDLQGFVPTLPDEAGYLAATVLTPEAYPFEVTRVGYDLGWGTEECDARLAHHTEVFVVDADGPPASPSVDARAFVSIPVDADPTADPSYRPVDLELEEPIVLEDGESIVVAVAMEAGEDLTTSPCIQACGDTLGIPGVDYWSNAVAEPYNWADIVTDYGFTVNFWTTAVGTVQ